MKQKKLKEEGEHEVNITVTIAKASLTDNEFDSKKNDLPQVQNYFHCQYKLLPDDRDYVKTDVVTFGMAAKMYGDNDSKVLRTWLEGNKTWVAWTSSRKVRVTQEALLKMFKHKIELQVWDAKDKVSAKARFDRPKAFRLPQTKASDEVDLEAVRQLLMQEGKTNVHLGFGLLSQSTVPPVVDQDPSKKVSFLDNNNEKELGNQKSVSSHLFMATSDSKLEVQVRLDENKQPEFKNLMTLASSGPRPLLMDTVEKEETLPSVRSSPEGKTSKQSKRSRSRSIKLLESDSNSSGISKRDQNSEKIQQHGLSKITIPLSSLFTNSLSISNSMGAPVSSLKEVILIISLDSPLLSDRQRQVLNPMVLTVGSASQMPDNYMSFAELQTRCLPPYIKYKFHDCPEHISEKKQHGRILKFSDRNVVLLGAMKKERLFEYLRGPAFKIEVHDRDQKKVNQKKSSVFGSNLEDNSIWNVTYTGSQIGMTSSSVNDCTYGIAEFDLSELLAGERIVQLISPIRNCHKTPTNINQNLYPLSKSNTGIPPGNYLEYGSDLKVKVELARSLIQKNIELTSTESRVLSPLVSTTSIECPFNRMVYVFDYKNRTFLGDILSQLSSINAEALDLSTYPQHVIDAALSTYKLTDQQKKDKTLNIITGCQIIDGNYHIFILEGLAKEGVLKLWNNLIHPEYMEDSFFHVLYNSEMSFTERLYVSLDVDLTRVRLHQPLDAIVKQPLLYIRDMIPRLTFDAVTKLYQLCQCTTLHNAVRNEVLPSAEMIVSLGKEFGVPITSEDLHDAEKTGTVLNEPSVNFQEEANDASIKLKSFRRHEPLDMTNEMYEKILKERKNVDLLKTDHICSNIKSLLKLSKAKIRKPTVSCVNILVPHNYSSQTLNSTVMANDKLREILTQDKGARFTYCKDYNSATIVPVSMDNLTKDQQLKSKSEWKTKEGFVFPGVKSSIESNHHPKPLHPARLHELYKPWRENILHANIVKPTVDRLLFKWEDRNIDFDALTSAEPFFGKPAPVTIHSAGDTLQNEKIAVQKKEEENWKDRLVVDNEKFNTHRCLIATELTNKGPKASNQQGKLTEILKDQPKKYSLVKPGMHHQVIPPLSVVSYPSVDTSRREKGLMVPHEVENEKHTGFTPGQLEGVSWSRDKNVVPIKDYQHEYFETRKGQEFRLVHTDREKVLMKLKPLTVEEKDNNLFA